MRVKEIMTKSVITVKRSTTLAEILEMFRKFHTFPLVPVVGEDGRLVGTISLQNLIEAFQEKGPSFIKHMPFMEKEEIDIFALDIDEDTGFLLIADDIMERKFTSISEDDTIEHTCTQMKLHSVERLPVMNKKGKLTGIIGRFDILLTVFKEKGILK